MIEKCVKNKLFLAVLVIISFGIFKIDVGALDFYFAYGKKFLINDTPLYCKYQGVCMAYAAPQSDYEQYDSTKNPTATQSQMTVRFVEYIEDSDPGTMFYDCVSAGTYNDGSYVVEGKERGCKNAITDPFHFFSSGDENKTCGDFSIPKNQFAGEELRKKEKECTDYEYEPGKKCILSAGDSDWYKLCTKNEVMYATPEEICETKETSSECAAVDYYGIKCEWTTESGTIDFDNFDMGDLACYPKRDNDEAGDAETWGDLECDSWGAALNDLQNIFNFAKILVPLLIIGLSTFDFIKAVVSKDDKGLKKAFTTLLKRLVLALIFFFLPVLINILLEFMGNSFGVCID